MNIFDLNGVIEYLPAIADELERNREVGGDINISFSIPKHMMNEHVFPMLTVESKIELPDGQKYTIKDIKDTLKGRIPYKTIQAQHEFFDIIDKRLPSVGARNGSYSFASMVEWILKPTGWKYTIEGTFYSKTYENWFGNSLKLFQDLIKDHSAEFWPDSNTKTVTIKKALGKITDAQIRWGHNLKTINQSINTNNLSTCIKAYGKKKTETDYLSDTTMNYSSLKKTGTWKYEDSFDAYYIQSDKTGGFTFEFTGTGFTFATVITMFNGKWTFTIDNDKTKTITTWTKESVNGVYFETFEIFRGLENKKHTVKAVPSRDTENPYTKKEDNYEFYCYVEKNNAITLYKAFIGDAQYLAVVEYKSPTVAIWGERWAEEWEDERYTTNATLSEAAAARIADNPEVSLEAEYVELRENGQNVHDFDIGDDVYLIVELLGVDVRARVLKITDYPLSNGRKSPKITISNIRKNIKDIMANTTKRAITAQGQAQTASKQAAASMETASNAALSAGRAGEAAQIAQEAAESATAAAESALQAVEGAAPANHTHEIATTSLPGFMSAADKTALNKLNSATESVEITSLANDWVIDAGYDLLTINKTATGEIYFTGRLIGGVASESAPIFTIQEKYRPVNSKMFIGASPGSAGIIEISTDGTVFIHSAGAWISLENVRYNL